MATIFMPITFNHPEKEGEFLPAIRINTIFWILPTSFSNKNEALRIALAMDREMRSASIKQMEQKGWITQNIAR